MSTFELTLPDEVWEDEEEGVLSNWFYRDGADVKMGNPLAEVMVAKVEFEIVAPCSGTLSITVPQGEIIRKGVAFGTVTAS